MPIFFIFSDISRVMRKPVYFAKMTIFYRFRIDPRFSPFSLQIGANIGQLLHGDVSVMTSLNCQEQIQVISVISLIYHAYAINFFHGCKIDTFQMRDCDMSRVVRKPAFCICKNKGADKLISAFVFATLTVQSLFYLNPKFQAISHLLRLYIPVCVGPGRTPRRLVFSQRGSYCLRFALTIWCGYTLELPHCGGSNEYPKVCFKSKN